MAWEELHVVRDKLADWMVMNMTRWHHGQMVAPGFSVSASRGDISK